MKPGGRKYEDESNHHSDRAGARRRARKLTAWRARAKGVRRKPESGRLLPPRRRRHVDLSGQTGSRRRGDRSPAANAIGDGRGENRRENTGQKADGRPGEILSPLG